MPSVFRVLFGEGAPVSLLHGPSPFIAGLCLMAVVNTFVSDRIIYTSCYRA